MPEPADTLSLAQRITKPIPLAALGVLALVVVTTAVIAAGGAQVGKIGYTIIGVVALVALATLVVAVLLTRQPSPSIRGDAQGHAAPGVVGGHYVVDAEVPSGGPTLPSGIQITGTAKGNYAPGVVGGNYVVGGNPSNESGKTHDRPS
jgi:hypothetical protein